jgi:autotransporter-associated beta strand protein
MKRLFPVIFSCLIAGHCFAGSATWSNSPVSGDWNTAANWTPATVPNGPNDVATFGVSSTVDVSIPSSIEVNSIAFTPGASAFIITLIPPTALTISGTGIPNDSGVSQNFVAYGSEEGSDIIQFTGSAIAGSGVVLTNNAGPVYQSFGKTYFYDTSSAGNALLINNGGYSGGHTSFFDTSTAAEATIIANGSDQYGGGISFGQTASSANARLIANGGVAYGGDISGFLDANTTRIETHDNGALRTPYNFDPQVGSIEGDGIIILAISYTLTVGNDLSTTFSGVIEDDPVPPIVKKSSVDRGIGRNPGGNVRKTGSGTLTLSGGSSTYTGGTVVKHGGLIVSNTTGSATGRGKVTVEEGTLGGGGKIAGPTTIGTDSGVGGFLEPGKGANNPTALTIKNTLTFKGNSTYIWKLNTNRGKADNVIATGVTIETGAQFSFNTVANKKLTIGKVFTAISNRSANPISGTFANLADGSTVTVGVNNFQASYSGGDGNDLTLTVVE